MFVYAPHLHVFCMISIALSTYPIADFKQPSNLYLGETLVCFNLPDRLESIKLLIAHSNRFPHDRILSRYYLDEAMTPRPDIWT
jgi:hypothetical protein